MAINIQGFSLTPGQIRVLLFLHDKANPDGLCYQYIRDIAKGASLNPDSARRAIRALAKLGIISREQMWATDDSGYEYPDANMYEILKPEVVVAIRKMSFVGFLRSSADSLHNMQSGQGRLIFPPGQTCFALPPMEVSAGI